MKFDFNTLFVEKLTELLKTHLKPLQARLDTLESNQLTEDDRHALEVVNESSLQDYDLQEFYGDFDDIRDRVRNIDNYLEEHDLETMYCDISSCEGRLEDLEHQSFAQDQNDENSNRIKELEDRVLHLENFILKTLKGFKDD